MSPSSEEELCELNAHSRPVPPEMPARKEGRGDEEVCRGAAAIVYPFTPHYRTPVFRALLENDGLRAYRLFSGRSAIEKTIKIGVIPSNKGVVELPTFTLYGLTFQMGLLRVCISSKFRHIIFLGDPHFITTWIYAVLARMAGRKVWFWTHGWLRLESGTKGLIRKLFYALPHGLLLYGERGKSIGVQLGFDPARLHVIYNSLDYDRQRTVRELVQDGVLSAPCTENAPAWFDTQPYLACIARLTDLCRFDLVIEALALLRESKSADIGMIFIGDGPLRSSLEALAMKKRVRCWFVGAVYDEETIAPLLYNARAVVSPGKVGLTAMHALAYGTPVISHDDFDNQMPEFEAIIPGVTGDFFAAGSSSELATVLWRWLNKVRDRQEREACYARIEQCYTPGRQRDLIEAALRTQD
jgi:glycosyltransferase involved in cell wall biosynthesis